MMLPKYIKKIPAFCKDIPVLKNVSRSSLYPYIFIKDEIYKDLHTEKPSVSSIALLHHEEKHRERQTEMGWFRFGLKYLFSPKFRLDEELLAYRVTMSELKKHTLTFDIERVAGLLSSPMYLWVCSRQEAKEKLTDMWKSC